MRYTANVNAINSKSGKGQPCSFRKTRYNVLLTKYSCGRRRPLSEACVDGL